jgi:hypothetical protein
MSKNRLLLAAAIGAACLTVPPSEARAQLTLGVGGGGSFPTGSLSNSYTTGYNVLASLGAGDPSWPVGLRFDGMFNQMQHQSDVPVGNIQIWTVNANIVYNIVQKQAVTPYLIGGAGYYNDSYRVTATDSSFSGGGNTHNNSFGLNGGGGLRFGKPSLSVFIEARVHYVWIPGGHYDFVPLTAGITF